MILDLSAFQEETLDVLMADGSMLHLKKPTQELAIGMMNLRFIDEKSPSEAIVAKLNAMVCRILNNNADGLQIGMDSVAALTLDVKTAILTGYSEFATKLQSNPTSASLQSPEKKPEKKRRSLCAVFARWLNIQD